MKRADVYEIGGKKCVRATDARIHFGELITRVRDLGETIYVERGTQAVMKLVPVSPDEMDDHEEPVWLHNWKAVQEEMRAYLAAGSLIPTPEDLIRDDRDNR